MRLGWGADSRNHGTIAWLYGLVLLTLAGAGCTAGGGAVLPGIDDILDGIDGSDDGAGGGDDDGAGTDGTADGTDDGGAAPPPVALTTFATGTGGATGLALRPSDGALFAVNAQGLFGPIGQGADLSTMTPLGATNLASMALFDQETASLVLAITATGEFWIGSPCCFTLAVAPAEGGDATAFEGLGEGVTPANIKPETMTIVPSAFASQVIVPGTLLVGQDNTFNRLATIAVAGDRAVFNVPNPLFADADAGNDLLREAHHLVFGLDGVLYGSEDLAALTSAGVQSIAADGTPADLVGTVGVSAHSFVVRANGDMVIRGTQQVTATESHSGILLFDAATATLRVGLELPAEELSEDDEMLITPDGATIYLSLPNRNEIVVVAVSE
ncbi:MAG: hypothetical protein HY763_02685 [Planctomycetes bacterium]|nr:hypothetical protein [Planctomycetota bacterium]